MVDIHSHIIPAIDDGVQSLEESLELIRYEVAGGTKAFVATPHVYNDQELADSPQIIERLALLREEVAKAGIDVTLHSGAEVYPSMSIATAIDQGRPITVNNLKKHVLVDLPMGSLPMDFDQILFEIQTRGVTPIIAHPERNAVFQHDPKKLAEYVERGIALQVNAGSLKGKYGQAAIGISKYILKKHWAHFLASDAHKPKEVGILREGVDRLADKLPASYITFLTVTCGQCIAEGRTLPPLPQPPKEPEEKKGFFGRMFGKK